MRNVVVVILWGLAAASLLFLSPTQAELEAEIPPATEPSLADVESDLDNSTNISIILDQFPDSDVVRQSNESTVPHRDAAMAIEKEEGSISNVSYNNSDITSEQEENGNITVVPHNNAVWTSEEDEDYEHVDQEGGEQSIFLDREIGNIRFQRSNDRKMKDYESKNRKYKGNKGRKNKDHSENHKGLRKKKVDARAKRRHGQRRRQSFVKLKSRKNKRGKKIKPNHKQIRRRKKHDRHNGKVTKSEISGEDITRTREENGKPSFRKKSKRAKRCKPKAACRKKKGKCRTSCKRKEIEFGSRKCKGRCVCCIRKVKQCKQKGLCLGQGTCRNSCLANEKPASFLPCKSSKCICCISDSGQGACTQNTECAKVRGTCKAACSGEKVVLGLCAGPHCSCCVPPASCSVSESCKHNGGTCKSICKDTEVRLPGSCNQGCFCCGPEPTQCTQTPLCPGKCATMCNGVVSLEAHCLGSSCLCCLDCSPTQACIDAKGKCKSLCGCGEKVLPNGCKGGGCKCCVADIPDCEMKQTGCNSCKFTPLCTGGFPTEVCKSGGPGCSCCPA